MIHYLSNCIAHIFVLYGESTEEDADIYTYAIEAVLAVLFNLALCLIISFLFGRILEGLLFISAFALLRRFTGGYHADTHYKCILTFSILLTCAMLITYFLSGVYASSFIALIIATMAWLGIFALAPIDDKNRHYKGEMQMKLKKKSIAVSTCLFAFCAIAGFALNTDVALMLSLSMFSVFGSMVYAKCDHSHHKQSLL